MRLSYSIVTGSSAKLGQIAVQARRQIDHDGKFGSGDGLSAHGSAYDFERPLLTVILFAQLGARPRSAEVAASANRHSP